MDWDVIAPMIVMIVLIVTAGGVAVLRPISKQLAQLLQAMTQERLGRPAQPDEDAVRMRELLVAMESRLALLEERQGFTEALMDGTSRPLNGADRGTAVVGRRSARTLEG
jgi:hypothetical protein